MPEARPLSLILSAEHITNYVPHRFRHLFAGTEEVLNTHRGWDPGTLDVLEECFRQSDGFSSIQGEVTRLLVELNRSPGNPEIFSEFTASLPAEEKAELLAIYYHPYVKQLGELIQRGIDKRGRVLHLGLHSFTPIWKSLPRDYEIGLLFDPEREAETKFCALWSEKLQQYRPEWRIMDNLPYAGTDDGLTTYFRNQYPESGYLGLELEINQKLYFTRAPDQWAEDVRVISETFRATVKTANEGFPLLGVD